LDGTRKGNSTTQEKKNKTRRANKQCNLKMLFPQFAAAVNAWVGALRAWEQGGGGGRRRGEVGYLSICKKVSVLGLHVVEACRLVEVRRLRVQSSGLHGRGRGSVGRNIWMIGRTACYGRKHAAASAWRQKEGIAEGGGRTCFPYNS